jgi:hypothetical protein
VPTAIGGNAAQAGRLSGSNFQGINPSRRNQMPVILWLLGVPLVVVVLLMLLNIL